MKETEKERIKGREKKKEVNWVLQAQLLVNNICWLELDQDEDIEAWVIKWRERYI